MTIIGALSYGELAAMMPRLVDNMFTYARPSAPLWGFLYGWTLFLVIQTGTIAAVGVAFGKFLGVFFPSVARATGYGTSRTSRHPRRPHGAGQHGHRPQHR